MKKTILLACALGLAAGCGEEGKVTGGGSLLDADGNKQATVAFNAQDCNGSIKGQIQFNAKDEGVKFHGDVTNVTDCAILDLDSPETGFCDIDPAFGCIAGEYSVEFDYRSTNPAVDGEGAGFACISDTPLDDNGGNGAFVVDAFRFLAVDGPYAGFSQAGEVRGNVQEHACPPNGNEG